MEWLQALVAEGPLGEIGSQSGVLAALWHLLSGEGLIDARALLRILLLSGLFTLVCVLAFPRNAPTRRLLLLSAILAIAVLPLVLQFVEASWPLRMHSPPELTLELPLPNLLVWAWWGVASVLIVQHIRGVRNELKEIDALPNIGRAEIDAQLAALGISMEAADRRARRVDAEMWAQLRAEGIEQALQDVDLKEGTRACSTTMGGAKVVLPQHWQTWDASTLLSVLAHELTHIRRRDDRWLFVTRLVVLAYWWMPWLIGLYRMHVRAMEESCDDVASEQVAKYPHALLDAARVPSADVLDRPSYRSVTSMHEHHLVGRIGRFLELRQIELDTRGVYWWVLGVGVFVVLLTGVEPVHWAPKPNHASEIKVINQPLAQSAQTGVVAANATTVPTIAQHSQPALALSQTAHERARERLDQPVYRAPVVYPGQALRAQVEGIVVLEYRILRDGSVVDAQVLRSEPPGVFDHAAIRATQSTRYHADRSSDTYTREAANVAASSLRRATASALQPTAASTSEGLRVQTWFRFALNTE